MMDMLTSKQNHTTRQHGRSSIRRFGLVFFVTVVALLSTACGGGGGGSTPTASAPAVPAATIGFDVKQLNFSWGAVSGADFYKLLENADGASGFSVIQNNIATTSASKTISVVNHDWANARYMVEACNSTGCTASAELNTAGAVLKAIGFVKASNTGVNDEFSSQNAGGYSGTPAFYFPPAIVLSGDGQTLAVGASREDGPDQGVSADQITPDDGTADASGAVYVFRHRATGWAQQAYIKASDSAANGLFGMTLTLSQDGNTLAVSGSSVVRKVYVLRFSGSSWGEQAWLSLTSADHLAHTLALDDSGDILFVGKPFLDSGSGAGAVIVAGSVAVYRFDNGTSAWSAPVDVRSDAPLTNAHLGVSLSVSGDGNVFVAGANGVTVSGNSIAGAAYVFRYDTGSSSWAQEALLSASNPDVDDNFGRAVAISRDGSTIAVGAIKEDGAGTGVSNGGTGDTANGAADSGAVYVYRLAGGRWDQKAYIKASNTDNFGTLGDQFGNSLVLSRNGNILVVGAPFEDSAATGVGGDQNDNTAAASGAAYQYQFNATLNAWDATNIAYIKAADTDASGRFAQGVTLSDDGFTLAVSGDGEDSNVTGVTTGDDPALMNFSAVGSGAVYLY